MTLPVHPLAGLIAGVARLISGVQVRWIDPAPVEGQCVYFANHTSHLDFVVLWSSLPPLVRRRTRPVAAQDYWEKGIRRTLAVSIFHAVLVARGGHGAHSSEGTLASARGTIERLVESMGGEYSLIIFPEGTRGTGEEIAPFKSGLYHLCRQKPNLALVPVYINNLNRILPKGEFLPVPFISELTFGPPMRLEACDTKLSFLTRARESLCRLRNLEAGCSRATEPLHETQP